MKVLTPAGKQFAKKVEEDILTADFFAAALRSGHGPKDGQALGEWIEQTFREANEAIAAKMSYEQREGHRSSTIRTDIAPVVDAYFSQGNCESDSTSLRISLRNISDPEMLIKLSGANGTDEPTFSYAVFHLESLSDTESDGQIGRYALHSLHEQRPDIKKITSLMGGS